MPKNIVILMDGTSNEVSESRTNILRLYGTLAKNDGQLVYYDPGVGTFGAENSWLRLRRKFVEVWGLATGWGLDQNVKEAYRFLVENYDSDEKKGIRDSIYIFGFSRGAYSARVLAGFIHAVGLIDKRNLNLVDYAYRAYARVGDAPDGGDAFSEVRLYERLLQPKRPPIRLLGLFDTVASVIEQGRFYVPRLRYHAFTRRNSSVEAVRHAVAIDERRVMFRPQLWDEGGEYRSNRFNSATAVPQDVREVWFTGCHCDVGGGHPESKSRLAKVPLAWMIEQTRGMGLNYITATVNNIVLGTRDDAKYVKPDGSAPINESMNFGWSLLEFLPARSSSMSRRKSLMGVSIPFFERRAIPEKARIHQSVLDRAKASKEQKNLPVDRRIEDPEDD